MRRLTALAAVVLVAVAGCAGSGDEPGETASDTPDAVTEPAPSPTAHEAVAEPFQLELQPPSGFSAAEGERDALVADEHVTYNFTLTGAHADSRLIVTTYLLPEGTATDGYDAQAAAIVAYDDVRGNTISHGKHSPTIIGGYTGVYRFAKLEIGGEEVSQQNHYLFAGRHLIQITCQWNYDFNDVFRGCKELASAFNYPAEWPLPYREAA